VPGTRPPGGTGTDVLVAVPVAKTDAMAAPAVLVATSTSYATWEKPPAWVYVQTAVGVIVLIVPEGAVMPAVGKGGTGVKADIDQPLQCVGVLAFT